jgi:hypothetical protein
MVVNNTTMNSEFNDDGVFTPETDLKVINGEVDVNQWLSKVINAPLSE